MSEDGKREVHDARVASVRLAADLAKETEMMARIKGQTFSEFVREAIAIHLKACYADPILRDRALARIEADRARIEADWKLMDDILSREA